ncbi:MAG: hypothetical protein ABSC94_14465 [Polyangiaceae bacterium]
MSAARESEPAGASTATLVAGEEIPEQAWIVAQSHARFVGKDPRTTRETTFWGPGRFLPCVGHREESWVGAGRFESSLGAGEAPGAEEWVVTPVGILRYSAAKAAIDVHPGGASLQVDSGTAFLWVSDDAREKATASTRDAAADDTSDLPWRRISAGTRIDIAGDGDARMAVERCGERASHAELLARLLLSHDGGLASGRQIAGQVRARRLARASCAVAALRVARMPLPDERRPLAEALRAADERWAGIPRPSP